MFSLLSRKIVYISSIIIISGNDAKLIFSIKKLNIFFLVGGGGSNKMCVFKNYFYSVQTFAFLRMIRTVICF